MNRKDACLAALVAALWGFNFVVIDWGMGTVPPLLFAAIRFSVVAVPACFLVKRPPVPFTTVAAVGAFMSLGQFAFLYLSLHLGMPPGLAALVLQAQVPFSIVIAAVALRERPGRAQVAGVALGVIGLVTVAIGIGGHVPLIALALCLLAGLSWGAGNVVSRASRAP
ncbi:MAG TPA: EamA family transporter, partial [Trebonia sp.]